MITFIMDSEICNIVDPIDTNIDPDIKRSIHTEFIDAPLSAVIEPKNGNMMAFESMAGKINGSAMSTDLQAVGMIRPFIRKDLLQNTPFGNLLVLKGGNAVHSNDMPPEGRELAVNIMMATLQLQQYLESSNILPSDPVNDPSDAIFKATVENGKVIVNQPLANESLEVFTKRGTKQTTVGDIISSVSAEASSTTTQKEPGTNNSQPSEAEQKVLLQKKYDADMMMWRSECAEVESKRTKQLEERRLAAVEDIKSVAKKKLEEVLVANESTIKSEKEKSAREEAELKTLGLFAMSQKKQLKQSIEESQNVINAAEAAIKEAKEEYNQTCANAEKIAESGEKDRLAAVAKELPMPAEPDKPELIMTVTEIENKRYKKAILETLSREDRPMTVTEIGQATPALFYVKNMRISAMMTQLVKAEKVTQTDTDKKRYYSIIR